jgi:hypothetical protein
MKPNGLVHVAASEIIVKASGSTGEGVEISLTSQRMGVVNLVITYKIDGGNLIDFILLYLLCNCSKIPF